MRTGALFYCKQVACSGCIAAWTRMDKRVDRATEVNNKMFVEEHYHIGETLSQISQSVTPEWVCEQRPTDQSCLTSCRGAVFE
jgi:hypothetical protein